ncbi:MAG: nitroreductase, partial [Candidatus Hodarchaeales archaeon]
MDKKIGNEFLEKTQYEHMEPSDQSKGLSAPPLELDYNKTKPLIQLPLPRDLAINSLELRKCIENRQSVRKYSTESLSLEELSWLLWTTQGIKPADVKTVT